MSEGVTPWHALKKELGPKAATDLGLALLRYIQRLEETANPYWVDMAVSALTDAGAPLPDTIQTLVSRVAALRLKGAKTRGGPSPVVREEFKGRAFALMTTLIDGGMTVENAAARAADAMAMIHGSPLYGNATLEKEYGRYRNSEQGMQFEAVMKVILAQEPVLLQALHDASKVIPCRARGRRR